MLFAIKTHSLDGVHRHIGEKANADHPKLAVVDQQRPLENPGHRLIVRIEAEVVRQVEDQLRQVGVAKLQGSDSRHQHERRLE